MAPKKPKNPKKVPPKQTLLQKLEQAQRQQKIEAYTRESYKWIINYGKKISSSQLARDLIKQERKRALRTDPTPVTVGSLVIYQYDPKHKDILPYYDQFPCGFLIDVEPDRFHLINLHFLPPSYRAVMFDKLLTLANNTRIDKTTKLRLSYAIIRDASRFKALKVCYREYLLSHMQSRIIKIAAADWEKVMFLPLQKFQKKSASQIWSDSINNITKT